MTMPANGSWPPGAGATATGWGVGVLLRGPLKMPPMAGFCTPCGITGTTGITTGVAVAVGPGVTVATGVGVALAGGAVTTSVAEAALPGPADGAVTGLVVFGYVPGPVTVT